MSILFKGNNYILLDHRKYFCNVYNINDKSLSLMSKLFSIKNQNKISDNKKRPRRLGNIVEETMLVKRIYQNIIKNIPLEIKMEFKHYDLLETSNVRELSQNLFESTLFDHLGKSGGNNSDVAVQCTLEDNCFLIPPNSRFFCGDVKEQCSKLAGHQFDIVIADPPWWNKYIRRLKNANAKLSYSMMYNEDIASLPIKDMVSDNCLVAVWCTNAPSNIEAVTELIFPKWGVDYLTTWYWLKVTVDMEPLCEFSAGCKKQPYERIILGKIGNVEDVPCDQVIASVPSALHSHKPPLIDLLKRYICKDDPSIVELFSRYLLPNTTSLGYEPLKWQHISLYEET